MKKFISFVMAGAMVASLVPATAFAKGDVTATAKVIDAAEETDDFGGKIEKDGAPEVQLKVTGVDYQETSTVNPELEITVTLDGAEFEAVLKALKDNDVDDVDDLASKPGTDGTVADDTQLDELAVALEEYIKIIPDGSGTAAVKANSITDIETDEFTFTVENKLEKDDVIAINLASTMTKDSKGAKATVSIDSKAVSVDDLVYATVLDTGIKVSIKKTVDVAEEEVTKLNSKGLTIEAAVGKFAQNQKFELKLSNGFEFTNNTEEGDKGDYTFSDVDDNEMVVTLDVADLDEFTIDGDDIEIEATSAKSGAVAKLTVKAISEKTVTDSFSATETVEVAKVVDYKVNLSVDEDEDVPVIYSGVNVANKGITDDSDHLSLEVTAEETFPGAWSMRQGFNFNLPEGVYVTDVKKIDAEHFYQKGVEASDQDDAWAKAFFDAYQDGDHQNFEFGKRVFDDVNTNLADDPAKVTFQLELVADPTFEGDVKLTMEGSLVDKQEVTIAKFVKPYTVKAEQNDLIIDYRNTEIKTPIVITEAEEGLWEEDTEFRFSFDKDDVMEFEDDATFEIDKDSDLEVKDETKKGTLKFTIDEESDSPATVTIKDMKLFMNRNIPAGAYDLEIGTTMADAYDRQELFAADANDTKADDNVTEWKLSDADRPSEKTVKKDSYVDDVCDYSEVVKEAFVNVVTGGRDQDNLFTTKVVVPVGESYLVAGEEKVELDVAAYISEAGYTMLPVRAISKALGVNTNNVLWNADARTVTIMYGQRIITMTVGQKVIYVNGSAVPASAAPEIKDGRTFLPLRDLGTALGVTDVSWDAATKTATMNGGK